ncbi:MAG: tyrosine-type recombinase/integrase [Nitrospira sp. CR1.3]|nr:tyrosine-type recombinase/integrase [Nitrospira sp. CR1.3]
MGLTKRNDSYYVEFRVLDDGKTLSLASGVQGAKLKRWKVGCTNKTMAKQQEAIIKTKLLAGTMESDRTASVVMTIGQWVEEYKTIEEVVRLRSYRERCQRIDRVIVPFFGSNQLLGNLTAKDVEAFRQERGNGRAVATVNVDHNILKHMLKLAMKRDLLTRNVASLVAAPKPKNARNRVLEPKEWERLYGAAPGWFKPVLLTGYHTGMRLEEILGLTWDRVDLEKGRIFLPGSLTKNGESREVPLTPLLKRSLQHLQEQDRVVRIGGLVFHKDGTRLNHTYRVVQELCREQKIEDFVFHDLRHCAVTNLADAGVDVETIMKIVGHSSVEMFLRYRTVKAEKLDAAMSRLNTLITRRQTAARQVSEFATH